MSESLHEIINYTSADKEIKKAIAAGADVNERDDYRDTPLHKAAAQKWGGEESARVLLAAGADVNAKNKHAETPLHISVFHKLEATTRLLLEAGADVNAEDKDGRTPLFRVRDIECLNLLLDAGADVNAVRDEGLSVLADIAMASYKPSKDCFLGLLRAGAVVLIQRSIWVGWDIPTINNVLKDIQKATGIDIKDIRKIQKENLKKWYAEHPGPDPYTPLPKRTQSNKTKERSSTQFLSSGSNISLNEQIRKGTTLEKFKSAIAAGADVNERDEDGERPLTMAVMRNRNPEIIRMLLEAGANPEMRMEKLLSNYIHKFGFDASVETVKSLIEAGADINTFCFVAAIEYAKAEIVQVFIDNGVDLLATIQGRPILIYAAARCADGDTLRVLLEAGLDPHVRIGSGDTALHAAVGCEQTRIEKTKLLLEYGVDVNAKNKSGETPLHKALEDVAVEKSAIIIALIEAGADVNAKDEDGNTPLHMAMELLVDQEKIVRILLESGADVNVKNSEGNTPMQVAEDNQVDSSIINILRAAGAK